MPVVKWLHISDIHLNKDGVENRRLQKKLIDYLEKLSIQCNYVFCTGDLRYAPMGPFAENTVEVLRSICAAVGVPIENLFITPGNHDIDRDMSGRDDAIRDEWFNAEPKKYDPTIGTISLNNLNSIMAGAKEFNAILDELFYSQVQDLPRNTEKFGPHTLYKTEFFNIIGLDSTLVYTKEQYSNLIIGTGYLQKALEKCDPEKTIIVITHYSFDYLDRREQEIVAALFRDYNVRLWLSGHEHNNLFRKQRDFFYEFQCGNLLLEKDAKTCFLMAELNTETLEGEIRVYAWFSPDGWATYPFACPDADDPSVYCFNLSNNSSVSTMPKTIARANLRKQVFPLLQENHSIYCNYGPTDDNRRIIRGEFSKMWEQMVAERIIPNGLSVIEILESQKELLTEAEIGVLQKYKMHVLGLQKNHLHSHGFTLDAPRFPNDIFTILE